MQSEGIERLLQMMKRDYPLISKEEQKELAKKSKQGDMKARDKLVYSNMRLVANIARKIGRPRDFEDLVQEGVIGLMRAIEKYEPERDVKFSHYATWHLKQKMFRYLKKKNGRKEDPRIYEWRKRICKTIRDEGEQSYKELADKVGATEEQVKMVMTRHMGGPDISLDEEIYRGISRLETYTGEDGRDIIERIGNQELAEKTKRIMGELEKEEREVLEERLVQQKRFSQISEETKRPLERTKQSFYKAKRRFKQLARENKALRDYLR